MKLKKKSTQKNLKLRKITIKRMRIKSDRKKHLRRINSKKKLI